MGAVKLYKYLDFTDGLMMLHYSNITSTKVSVLVWIWRKLKNIF